MNREQEVCTYVLATRELNEIDMTLDCHGQRDTI